MFCGAPNMAATALAGTPLAMKAMPGPEPMPMSIEPEARSCCSLASPADADSSISRPCLAKMPAAMPTSSGVNDQANGTTLATRSFSVAWAGASDAANRSTATPTRPDVKRAPKKRLIASSHFDRSVADGGEIIAELHAHGHAAGCGVALTGSAPLTRIVVFLRRLAGAPRAHHRFAFPLVAPIDFRQAVQARGVSSSPGQRQGRLQLFPPCRQRLPSQLLGRVVRSRQAVRIHGEPRPPGRRGLLDRPVLGGVLRHTALRRPRLRSHVERGDGRC